jgi:hypothetical protein
LHKKPAWGAEIQQIPLSFDELTVFSRKSAFGNIQICNEYSVEHERIATGGGLSMSSVYAVWTRQLVVLQLASEGMRVPMRGVIIGECRSSVRFCPDDGLDSDFQKEMVLVAEEVSQAELANGMLGGLPSKAGAREWRIGAMDSNREIGRTPNTF